MCGLFIIIMEGTFENVFRILTLKVYKDLDKSEGTESRVSRNYHYNIIRE